MRGSQRAVPGGTNADGTKSEIHSEPSDDGAGMVATTSAQIGGSRQVGLVSDRAGDGSTPLSRIPLKAGEAVRRTEAGIPPEPPEKAASTQEGKRPFGARSSRARSAGEEYEVRTRPDLQQGHQLRSGRRIIRQPSSASKVVGTPQEGRSPKTDLESRAVGSLEARSRERLHGVGLQHAKEKELQGKRQKTTHPVEEKVQAITDERVRRRRPVKEKPQEQSGVLEEQNEQKEQEKRLLARLQGLCCGAGRRSQHEQQQEQNVEKSHEEILAQQKESERRGGARGSKARGLRLTFVDAEPLEEGFGGIRKEEQQRARQECDSRSEGAKSRKADLH